MCFALRFITSVTMPVFQNEIAPFLCLSHLHSLFKNWSQYLCNMSGKAGYIQCSSVVFTLHLFLIFKFACPHLMCIKLSYLVKNKQDFITVLLQSGGLHGSHFEKLKWH